MARERFDTLERALVVLAAHVDELAEAAAAKPAGVKLRRYGPEEQVVGRVELAGPERRLASRHAGVDIRGDGSTEAYAGRIRKRALHEDTGEDYLSAIRRALSAGPVDG